MREEICDALWFPAASEVSDGSDLQISGFRWSFYGIADVNVGVSLAMTIFFLAMCLAIVSWIFKTGYRLKA